jgi:hypothetical protein
MDWLEGMRSMLRERKFYPLDLRQGQFCIGWWPLLGSVVLTTLVKEGGEAKWLLFKVTEPQAVFPGSCRKECTRGVKRRTNWPRLYDPDRAGQERATTGAVS